MERAGRHQGMGQGKKASIWSEERHKGGGE
jgi:hypothetical protein